MKAQIKMYKNDGAGKNGYPVKLIISHNKKIKRKTLVTVLEKYWDPVREIPLPSYPDFETLYSRILEIRTKAIGIEFHELEDLNQAMEFLLNSGKKEKLIDFYTYLDQRASYMRSLGREGNAISYEDSKKALMTVAPSLKFSELTPALISKMKAKKRLDGCRPATIRKYIAGLRAVYNVAVEELQVEDKKPFKGALRDLRVRVRRQRNRYLGVDQLKKLKAAQLEQKSYQRSIDLILLQFYLCGCDFIDVYYLKKKDIQNGRVFLSRKKLGDRAYEFDVKLVDPAKALIEKYQDDDPKNDYLFPWRKSRTSYTTFINNTRRDLARVKEIVKIELSTKDETLTRKVMRHTFATLGKFERIEEDLLRELMGHERDDIDTAYKDKYPEDERDAAQELLISSIG